MIQTGFDSRVKVQQIIESQLPSFILEESPNASEFLKQYYISQEYQGGVIDIAENFVVEISAGRICAIPDLIGCQAFTFFDHILMRLPRE